MLMKNLILLRYRDKRKSMNKFKVENFEFTKKSN